MIQFVEHYSNEGITEMDNRLMVARVKDGDGKEGSMLNGVTLGTAVGMQIFVLGLDSKGIRNWL